MPIPSWKTELKEVAPKVYAYIQGGGPGIDNHSVSNAGLINGDDSSMVIDALTAPVLTKAFIAAMKKVNPKPFRHLVNTHHHPDHVRGNCFFLPIEIIGHEKCREALLEAGMTFPDARGLERRHRRAKARAADHHLHGQDDLPLR